MGTSHWVDQDMWADNWMTRTLAGADLVLFDAAPNDVADPKLKFPSGNWVNRKMGDLQNQQHFPPGALPATTVTSNGTPRSWRGSWSGS